MSLYFDNAATTIHKPAIMGETVNRILTSDQYGNPSRGAHEYSLNAYRIVAEARETLKAFFQASERYEIAFTNDATVALNEVLKGILHPGDHVLTTSWEHNSVLRPLYQLEAGGVALDFISAEAETGALRYEEFAEKLRPETKVVVCNHASNVTGNLLDLDFVKAFCQFHDLLLVLDISQTAGVVPIDLQDEKIAALCFTGHKSLYGPQGTGGICIRKDVALTPVLTGGDGMQSFSKVQPQNLPTLLEAGTVNVPGIAGLAASVNWLQKNPASQQNLGNLFYHELKKINGLQVYGDFSRPRVEVFSINLKEAESAVVGDLLWDEFEIATRSGYHCAPLIHQALGTAEIGTVRFSFSRFTTKNEVEQALSALQALAKR